MRRRVPWFRVVAEGAAIVVSILLAFAVQAWWEARSERSAELASLRLIDRDLSAAVEQLEAYRDLMVGNLNAATSAYRALSAPIPDLDHDAVSESVVRASMRRTVSLPSAAYVDLVSTGNLRLIRDLELRDEIVRFYALADRTQAVIERNSTAQIDGMMWRDIFGRGIVLPRPGVDTGQSQTDRTTSRLRDLLGPDVMHGDDPLWSLGPGSPEWNAVRGTMLVFARSAIASTTLAEETIEAAHALQSRLRGRLGRSTLAQ